MKQLFAIILASFALTAFSAEPSAPAEKPKTEMKLAKKKDAPKADAKSAPAKTEAAPATTAKPEAKPAGK